MDINAEAASRASDMLLDSMMNILGNYKVVYGQSYSHDSSRDDVFLKELVDSLMGIESVLEVYVRDGNIHPTYALEKLKQSKSIIDTTIDFYQAKLNIENKED